jgi:nucleoside-diphosphate-sugar epimerase
VKVFVAGSSGAIGRRLIPQLIERGHQVVAMTRSAEKAPSLRTLGAEPVIADALDGATMLAALKQTEPDAVVHQMTSLQGVKDFKNFDREFEATNRLRTEGTDRLLTAARAVGVRRIVAQSYGNWNYARTGNALKVESDALDPAPPANQRQSFDALRYLEDRVTGSRDFDGIALRYANFYGPGTGFAPDGEVVALVRKRMLPVVGSGAGVWSFIHVDDAASATIAALERGAPGIYNIVDNEPAPVSEWLPYLAKVLGAGRPMRVPVWIGRLAVGDVGVSMMTQIRGTSNAKAQRELTWRPRYATWRDGFRKELS